MTFVAFITWGQRYVQTLKFAQTRREAGRAEAIIRTDLFRQAYGGDISQRGKERLVPVCTRPLPQAVLTTALSAGETPAVPVCTRPLPQAVLTTALSAGEMSALPGTAEATQAGNSQSRDLYVIENLLAGG
jgi:hypothetical protein